MDLDRQKRLCAASGPNVVTTMPVMSLSADTAEGKETNCGLGCGSECRPIRFLNIGTRVAACLVLERVPRNIDTENIPPVCHSCYQAMRGVPFHKACKSHLIRILNWTLTVDLYTYLMSSSKHCERASMHYAEISMLVLPAP